MSDKPMNGPGKAAQARSPVPVSSSADAPGEIRPLVFFSANRMDHSWRDRIRDKVDRLGGGVDWWYESRSDAAPLSREAEAAIQRASLVIVLLSPFYLKSEASGGELARLLERRKSPGMHLVFILAEQCPWKEVPGLNEFQPWATERPLKSLRNPEDEEIALDRIAADLRRLIRTPDIVGVRPASDAKQASISSGGHFPFSPYAMQALQRARELAHNTGRNRVTASCIFFGLISTPAFEREGARFLQSPGGRGVSFEDGLRQFTLDGLPERARVFETNFLGRINSDVQEILAAAEKIARSTSPSLEEIHPRHLFAALLVSNNGRPSMAISNRLAKLRINLEELAKEFRSLLLVEKADDQEAWNAVLSQLVVPGSSKAETISSEPPPVEVPPVRSTQPPSTPAPTDYIAGPAGFSSEFCGVGNGRQVVDHLGMEANARRLAELIALRETRLPLAIGLFGNWGSGKSHFMNLIDQDIRALAAAQKSRPVGPSDKWCRQIVPIYFNAWHYLDANLWASLVSQIFESLFIHLRPRQDDLKKVQNLLEQASGATARAAEEVAVATAATEKARDELTVARQTAEQQQTLVAGMLHGLAKLLPEVRPEKLRERAVELLGVEKEIKTIDDLRDVVRESQSDGARIRALWNSAWRQPGRGWRFAWLAASLIIVPAITVLAARSLPILKDHLHGVGQMVLGVLTSLSALIAALRPVYRRVADGLTELENWQKQAEAEQKRLLETPAVQEAKSNVKAAIAREEDAKIHLAEAEAREKQLKEEARNLAPERRLGRFIETRAQSGDYRGQLGIVSLARRDFQALSDLFADTEALKEKLNAMESPSLTPQEVEELSQCIDRIVLFVDDLDRCQPEKVVEVLQAVHLLLAFPLFAVVVGVDQRCLRQSLRLQFKGLLTPDQPAAGAAPAASAKGEDGRPATPLDYLEKIFHVPFHLPPMGDDGFKTLIKSLTKPAAPAPNPKLVVPVETAGQPSHVEPAGKPDAPANAGAAPLQPKRETAPAPPKAPGPDPFKTSFPDMPLTDVVGSVPLQDWERTALEAYHPLIGTPRAAKRLLNTYRLVRAGVPEAEWNAFKGDGNQRGEFRVAMLLLAGAAGYPAVAREWFALLRTAQDFPNLHQVWPLRSDPEWLAFRALYDLAFASQTPNLSRELLLKWVDRIEVFAF